MYTLALLPFVLVAVSVLIIAAVYVIATKILNVKLSQKDGTAKKIGYGSALVDVIIAAFLAEIIGGMIPASSLPDIPYIGVIIAGVIYAVGFGIIIWRKNITPSDKKIIIVSVLVISAIILDFVRAFALLNAFLSLIS